MKRRIVISLILVVVWVLFGVVYNNVRGPLEGAVVMGQLANDDVTYATSRALVNSAIPTIVNTVMVLTLVSIWLSVVISSIRKRVNATKNEVMLIFLVAFIIFGVAACGPYQEEKIIEIQPSETAFLVKLEGDTMGGQDAFVSEDFLLEHKVAVKRISLSQRKVNTGRGFGAYKWIATARVILVDRKPVTREWTKGKDSGTSNRDEAIHVESKDSIGFGVGVNITTAIPEKWAARFLYNFAGKTLEEVTDQNVRGFVQASLSREFGSKDLEKGREAKKEIFDVSFQEAQEYFSDKGVSVEYMGFAEGLVYDDEVIQTAINEVFQAQLDVQKAEQQKLAQVERNALMIAKATAERESAEQFAQAQEAAVARVDLEIKKMQAEALLVAAQKWNGATPSQILPQGSSMLFGLDVNK